MKKSITCECGAEYGYKGIIKKGCLYCFNCGRELVNSKEEFGHKKFVERIYRADEFDNRGCRLIGCR